MSTVSRVPGAGAVLVRGWAHWPRVATWAAMLWSAAYAMLGLVWWYGVSWYPFGPVSDDRRSGSPLEGAPASVVGPGFAGAGLVGVVVAVTMLRGPDRAGTRRAAIAVGVVLAVTCTCLVPDYTMLALLAMWPAFLVFAFTGVPGAQDGLGDILYWHRDNLLLIFAGGVCWALATLAFARTSAGRCGHCGRRDGARPADRAVLLRIGRAGVAIAVLSMVPYDVTRIAWFLGWPLGLGDGLFDSFGDPPFMLTLGLILALLSTGGALLTHGLVARWGEVFPWWVPRLRGRVVRPWLAVAPAGLVTIVLPPSALMALGIGVDTDYAWADWGVWLPSVLQLGWAVGLGTATYAYYLRRRGSCRHCGQG